MQGKLVGTGEAPRLMSRLVDVYLQKPHEGGFGAVLAWCGAKTYDSLHYFCLVKPRK